MGSRGLGNGAGASSLEYPPTPRIGVQSQELSPPRNDGAVPSQVPLQRAPTQLEWDSGARGKP